MKIKTRNNIITFFMFVSMAVILTVGIISGLKIYTKTLYLPSYSPYRLWQGFFLTKFNYQSVFIAIFVILIYVFISFLFINISFEKTQSTEIIYLSLFLIGFLTEPVRLCFPLMNLWNMWPSFATDVSRFLLFGRLLAPFSLLFTVIYSNFESRQYVEQNLVILLAFSLSACLVATFNTNIIHPAGYVQFGLEGAFLLLRNSVLLFSIISQIIKSKQNHQTYHMPLGFFLMILGYIILINVYNYITLAVGTLCIFPGTVMYLKELHSQYLWN